MKKRVINQIILAVSITSLCACAEFRDSRKAIGHATRDITKTIGHGVRDTAKAIGHDTREVLDDKDNGKSSSK